MSKSELQDAYYEILTLRAMGRWFIVLRWRCLGSYSGCRNRWPF